MSRQQALERALEAAAARTVEWMDRYNAQVEAERQSMDDLRAKVRALRERYAEGAESASIPTHFAYDAGAYDAIANVLALLGEES